MVTVRINKTGGKGQSFGIDVLLACGVGEIPHLYDGIGVDRDIGEHTLLTTSVKHSGTTDHDIIFLFLTREKAEGQKNC